MQTFWSGSTREDAPQFLAGHTAPAGTYRRAGTGQEVRLDREDVLPATCDGHVAVYVLQSARWAEADGWMSGVPTEGPCGPSEELEETLRFRAPPLTTADVEAVERILETTVSNVQAFRAGTPHNQVHT